MLQGAPDVAAALATYEEQRRPGVASVQRAAQASLEWFEATERYDDLEPLQFAYSLLTRSLRITHENLRTRDPAFVERVERWYADKAGVTPVPGRRSPPPFLTPFRLRDLVLTNRVVVSTMCQYSAVDGVPNDWHLQHLASRAVGGAGLVMTEMTDVSAEGRITPGCTGIYNGAQVAAWRRIVRTEDRGSAVPGMENLYTIQLPSGQIVHSSESSTSVYQEGTAVELRISATHTVLFRADQPSH